MAKPGSLPVGRYFLGLAAILVVLYTIVFWPGSRHTPKLGLDLVGGTQIIFTAHVEGGGTPSSSAMSQAKQIITERVNSNGVTESTVVIQGSGQIVVSIPGATNVDPSTLGATAKLNFRGLVAPPAAVTCTPTASKSGGSTAPSSGASATSGTGGDSHSERLLTPQDKTALGKKAKKTPKASATATATNGASATSSPTTATTPAAPVPCSLKSVAQLKKVVKDLPNPAPVQDGKTYTSPVYTSGGLSASVAQEVQQALTKYDCAASQGAPDPVNDYYIACQSGAAYLLGPIVVKGTEITTAAANAPNVAQGQTQWTVSLGLKGSGQTSWGKYTSAHNVHSNDTNAQAFTCSASTTPCADFVAFTLDGKVLSTPVNEQAINGGNTQITGNFTHSSSEQLAKELKYGALPLNFTPDTAQTISATLGSSQLKAGMLAGGIGLILVVVYSLLYYRALGLVTIASLLVSGGLVYGSIVMLGTQMGFTLSLAGIAGFIVAVGITTDSFVVFFERIKDEVHEGRSVRVAIPRAWIRARRTILSADTVSVLAAAILYYFAAGDVKGFAFTLGLSTILDLVVVFLFTHPLISLLSRIRAFGTGKLTGLAHIRDTGAPPEASRGAMPARRAPRRDEAAAEGAVSVRKSSVATMEADEPAAVDQDVTQDVTGDVTQDVDADRDLEHGTDTEAGEPTERRHTAPEPGSAAERAAARRARLREKGER
ncbi:MAG TPA: protein translocase subunit SecD [Jatrophihabitantaceae bacterium]|nr:protein translocase subunit SecD [Jatrophihabitantaceae bacterium]